MACRLCQWFCNWICGPDREAGEIWRKSDRWEQDDSNDWDLWVADNEEIRQRAEHASEVFATDPALAFAISKELADNGSVCAMLQTGWHYEVGSGVECDLGMAEHCYYQALLGGSWTATLRLARLLFAHRINENWVGILENGIESNFVPASFWLAWFRYKRAPSSRTAREVRPLMERAAAAGHPGARMMLARWKILGRFGFREMRQGFRDINRLLTTFVPVDRRTMPRHEYSSCRGIGCASCLNRQSLAGTRPIS